MKFLYWPLGNVFCKIRRFAWLRLVSRSCPRCAPAIMSSSEVSAHTHCHAARTRMRCAPHLTGPARRRGSPTPHVCKHTASSRVRRAHAMQPRVRRPHGRALHPQLPRTHGPCVWCGAPCCMHSAAVPLTPFMGVCGVYVRGEHTIDICGCSATAHRYGTIVSR